MRAVFFSALVGLLVAGCANPLPVRDKPMAATDKVWYPFDSFDTFSNAQEKVKGFYLAYTDEAQNKRMALQRAKETGFFSGILAAIAGTTGAKNAAIAGASGAAGSSVYSEHYSLEVQATNYEYAAEAMACVHRAGRGITDIGLRLNAVQLSATVETPATKVALDAISDAFIQIRAKLIAAQNKVSLATPDLAALKSALGAPPAKVNDKSTDGEAKKQAMATFGASNLAAEQSDTLEAMKEYTSKVSACVAKFGG